MTLTSRARLTISGSFLLLMALLPGLAQLPAVAGDAPALPAPRSTGGLLGDRMSGPPDLDLRGQAAPLASQRNAVGTLGKVIVRWNRFGTPASLLPKDGSLGLAGQGAVGSARHWLESHAAIFGLSAQTMADLRLVNNQKFSGSPARAVLFQQRLGDARPAIDGLVTVGVAHGDIVYVSSTLARTSGAPGPAALGPVQAWAKAAADVGQPVSATELAQVDVSDGTAWTRLRVPGFADEQQVRLGAVALADGTVRPAYLVNVLDHGAGAVFGYSLVVDAVSGKVLHRHNQVQQENDTVPVQGSTTPTECGPRHTFTIDDDATKSIVFVASFAIVSNDVVLKLYGPDGLLSSEDVGLSPEVLSYSAQSIPSGDYAVQVCPLEGSVNPVFIEPGDYAGAVFLSDTATPQASSPFPRWRSFLANPTPNTTTTQVPKNSVIGCWVSGPGCDNPPSPLRNPASVGPWDYNFKTGLPTFTTSGNNAETREAWADALAPGGGQQAPVSSARDYTEPFTDAWQNSRCDPANLHPGGNDINASVTNLFVAHNRMHDFAYYLGFTEENYNMQEDNHGRVTDPSRENDPEVGDAQAGALTGGSPSYLGRDNANQRTLQDGLPGITNQYLFQPIAGAFYAPCTDGGLDMGIVGHEYTHAISNRMIAGPDDGIYSEQGGAMGESWGDLTAGEYMFSHGYSNGGNVWAVGAYATGNLTTAIRDYAINHNPLNYSDYGFDSTGPEVHADGEIWNGTQWSVRQALVEKWDDQFPVDDRQLQRQCAQGRGDRPPLPVSQCPGNRRWIQLVFDAFLLQQSDTSMLEARDAMLAADLMRFDGRDLKVMWDAFARRGMGKDASTPSPDSDEPTPSFASPRSDNAVLTIDSDHPGKLYVGQFEARATPVADTIARTDLGSQVRLVPGRHDLLFVSPEGGFERFTVRVSPGERLTVHRGQDLNLAAREAGASVIGSSAGSRNPTFLIDGTEATAWGGESSSNVDQTHPYVTVDLAGGVHKIHAVQVSAMLNPPPPDALGGLPLAADPDSGSRFTALRKFALESCVRDCGAQDAKWDRIYVSPSNAFPSELPRPVSPTLIMRHFDVDDVRAAAIRLVALENQCTGYAGYAGEQDNDPTNDTDCKTASDRGSIVHAAELQVF